MSPDQARDIARRAAAKYFGVGIMPSYVDEFLDAPHMQDVPAIKMMNCVIQAIVDADVLPLEEIDA